MWFQSRRKHPIIRTIVGEGCTIRGELRFADGVRIDGEVHGDVVGEGPAPTLVVVGDKGRIEGKLQAGHVIISGEVSGSVRSDELLELRASARIDGDVRYEALEMHKGASISGELRPLDASECGPSERGASEAIASADPIESAPAAEHPAASPSG